MTKHPTPIPQESVDLAFREGKASKVVVTRISEKRWVFHFWAVNPATGKGQTYTLKTQRGKIRTWSDPRNLFAWLLERGVLDGSFVLTDEDSHDNEVECT
jgi:hypothetical protein